MTTIVTRANYSSDSNTFTLANGSQAGRAVVVVATQTRNPPDMSVATFNSAAPTGIQTGSHSVQTNVRTLVAFWNNAALPAAGGSFNITCNSGIHTVFELSGWDGATPEIVTGQSLTGASGPYTLPFVNSTASAGLFMATASATTTSITGSGGSVLEQYSGSSSTLSKIDSGDSGSIAFSTASTENLYTGIAFNAAVSGPDYTQRKGSTFTATHTLGTITTATLNAVNVFDHVSSQAAGTISFTGAITDERTTSGVVDLVLGDGAATQTQTVQVNVFGVVPSNNPAQKDGSALASLTGVQIRITAGANLNGTQVYYSGTETTDASGNFNTLDVSTSAAVAADPVLMQVLTAAGDSITSAETVGLI
jgi:hypothetical protein